MKSSEIINEIHSYPNLCQGKSADVPGIKNHIITKDEIVTLYHGSKSGLRGAIAPVSRKYRREGRFFDEILEADE